MNVPGFTAEACLSKPRGFYSMRLPEGYARGGGSVSAAARLGLGAGGSPWEDCGDYCEKECGLGNPICYGACYWHCVIRGGPPSLGIGRGIVML